MKLAVIKGHATSTVKHPSLNAARLMIALPVDHEGKPDGSPQVVVDPLGTGIGQKVIITSDGSEARLLLKDEHSPARWSVLAIVDPEGAPAL